MKRFLFVTTLFWLQEIPERTWWSVGDVWPSRAAEKRPLAVPRCVRPLSVDGPHGRRCRGAGRGGTGRKAHLEARRPTAPHYGSAGLADDLRTGLLQTRRRLVEGAPPFAFPVHCSTQFKSAKEISLFFFSFFFFNLQLSLHCYIFCL